MALPPTTPREPDPLRNNVPIVNADGTPTTFFIRQWLQQRGFNEVTPELVASITQLTEDVAALVARQIIAGNGLAGGGSLEADVTLSLDAALDNLNDVDTATVLPTNGQALVFSSLDGLWKPGSVSGGGAGSLPAVRVPTSGASVGAGENFVWGAPVFDDLGFWSAGQPDRLTIPVGSGITRVIVSVVVRSTAATIIARILRNGVIVAMVDQAGTTNTDSVTLDTGVLDVEEGDIFTVDNDFAMSFFEETAMSLLAVGL